MKAAQPEVLAATRVNPGETLRQARENNGWTLAEVALKLNLTASSLSNLETGAFDKLPGHTFARGYIRAYAKLLGMDQAALVREFDLYTGTDANGSNVHSLGRIEEPVRVSHTILRIVSLLLLIAVVGGGFIWWQDQTSMRAKDLIGLAPEHVEVEGADGTTRIHPLDEPEDQAVAEAKAEADERWLIAEPINPRAPAPQPWGTAVLRLDPSGIPAKVTATTDRRKALEGARYVISCVRVGGLEAYQDDIRIPLKYGVDQCVGERFGVQAVGFDAD